jgi:hypothetical protein
VKALGGDSEETAYLERKNEMKLKIIDMNMNLAEVKQYLVEKLIFIEGNMRVEVFVKLIMRKSY